MECTLELSSDVSLAFRPLRALQAKAGAMSISPESVCEPNTTDDLLSVVSGKNEKTIHHCGYGIRKFELETNPLRISGRGYPEFSRPHEQKFAVYLVQDNRATDTELDRPEFAGCACILDIPSRKLWMFDVDYYKAYPDLQTLVVADYRAYYGLLVWKDDTNLGISEMNSVKSAICDFTYKTDTMYKQGDYQGCCELLETVLGSFPFPARWISERHTLAYNYACVLCKLNRLEEALSTLERLPPCWWLGEKISCDPDFEPVRSSPRFTSIIGLWNVNEDDSE